MTDWKLRSFNSEAINFLGIICGFFLSLLRDIVKAKVFRVIHFSLITQESINTNERHRAMDTACTFITVHKSLNN